MKGDTVAIGGETLTEEEISVVNQALGEMIERLESDGDCFECAGGQDEESGATTHASDCIAAIAHDLRRKLGDEVEPE